MGLVMKMDIYKAIKPQYIGVAVYKEAAVYNKLYMKQ
jgi:hypothetical protein